MKSGQANERINEPTRHLLNKSKWFHFFTLSSNASSRQSVEMCYVIAGNIKLVHLYDARSVKHICPRYLRSRGTNSCWYNYLTSAIKSMMDRWAFYGEIMLGSVGNAARRRKVSPLHGSCRVTLQSCGKRSGSSRDDWRLATAAGTWLWLKSKKIECDGCNFFS